MLPRNRREGTYCGRTPAADGNVRRRHVRSRTCAGHLPGSAGASLEVLCRLIRRSPP